MMEDIDTGKVKTSRFTVDEFLKFVDKTVSEFVAIGLQSPYSKNFRY
jgi:hypothetical protein